MQAAEARKTLQHERLLQDLLQLFASGAVHNDIDVTGMDTATTLGLNQQVAKRSAHQIGRPSASVQFSADLEDRLLNGLGKGWFRRVWLIVASRSDQPGETRLKLTHELSFCRLPHGLFTTFAQG